MSARSEGARNLSNSVTGLINSGFNLASSIVDYKVDQKKREQILNSNKDVLETQYENEVGQLYQTLPESIDFSQYQTRIDSFNQDFISKAKSSGNYDEQTLSWLENEFMPGQTHKNEYALAGVTDYAVNTWLANNANSKANTLAADPNLSVEEAAAQYTQYYNRVGLNNIDNGANRYGYVTPEEFTEAIRGTKAIQEFRNDCREGYGYDPTWNTEKALQKALDKTGYSPNAVQMTQLRQQAQSAVSERISEIKNAISQESVNYSTDINNHILQGQYYDTSDLDDAIASYPVAYAAPLMELKVSAQKSNDVLVYNMIADGSAPLDDEMLSCLSTGSDYREKLISNDVSARAESMFNSGTQIRDVMAWIRNGDLGYTATSTERDAIAENVLKWAKEQKTTQEQMDDIDMYYIENPQLVGDPAVVSYSDMPVYQTETAGEGESVAESLAQTAVVSVGEVLGITPNTTEAVSLGTSKAQNAAMKTVTEQSMTPSVDNPDVYSQLYYMKYVQCADNDIVKAKVEEAYRMGELSKTTAEELAKDFVFGEDETWKGMVATIGETVDNLMPDATFQQRKNVKTRVVQAMLKNIGNDYSRLRDSAVMNSAMDMIAGDIAASSWLGKAESYSKVSDNPEGYIKALSKASYGDIRNAIADGSIMPFIDVNAQNGYLAGNPESSGSVQDAREFFTRELGFGTSYDALENDLQKLIVEYNVVYSQYRGDIRSLFVKTFKDYVDVGTSEMLWVDTEIGGTFAFSDSENKDLYYFPDAATIKKQDGRLKATWFYAYDTDGDRVPDTEPVKLTSLEGIVSDMSGYRKEQEKKAEENAQMSEGLSDLAQSAKKAGEEYEALAADKDSNLLTRSYAVGEASKQNDILTWVSLLGTFFGVDKGKYDDEEALVQDTLTSIRNQ